MDVHAAWIDRLFPDYNTWLGNAPQNGYAAWDFLFSLTKKTPAALSVQALLRVAKTRTVLAAEDKLNINETQ